MSDLGTKVIPLIKNTDAWFLSPCQRARLKNATRNMGGVGGGGCLKPLKYWIIKELQCTVEVDGWGKIYVQTATLLFQSNGSFFHYKAPSDFKLNLSFLNITFWIISTIVQVSQIPVQLYHKSTLVFQNWRNRDITTNKNMFAHKNLHKSIYDMKRCLLNCTTSFPNSLTENLR